MKMAETIKGGKIPFEDGEFPSAGATRVTLVK